MITLTNMKMEAIANTAKKTLFFVFRFIFSHPKVATYKQESSITVQRLLPGMYHHAVNAATEFSRAIQGVLPGERP